MLVPLLTVLVDSGIDLAAEIAPLLERSGLAIERSMATDTLFVIKRTANVPAHRRVMPEVTPDTLDIPMFLRRQAD